MQFKQWLQVDLQLYGNKSGRESMHKSVKSVPILIIFDNIDRLPIEVVKSFEFKLIDLIERNTGIRFMTSSKRTFSFKKFQSPKEKASAGFEVNAFKNKRQND